MLGTKINLDMFGFPFVKAIFLKQSMNKLPFLCDLGLMGTSLRNSLFKDSEDDVILSKMLPSNIVYARLPK